MPGGHVRPLRPIAPAICAAPPEPTLTQPRLRALLSLAQQHTLKLQRLTSLDGIQCALLAQVQGRDALSVGRLITPKLKPGAHLSVGLGQVVDLRQASHRRRRKTERQRHQHRSLIGPTTHQQGAAFSIFVPFAPRPGGSGGGLGPQNGPRVFFDQELTSKKKSWHLSCLDIGEAESSLPFPFSDLLSGESPRLRGALFFRGFSKQPRREAPLRDAGAGMCCQLH